MGVCLAVVAAALAGTAPADAAARRPPRVSKVKVVQHTDHILAIQFAVPAAYYHPGAGVVVRLTKGAKPAASPSKGYAVAVDYRHEAQAGARTPLAADTVYTFAIWVRDHGRFSRRLVFRARTLKDTLPPDDISTLESRATINLGSPRVVLSWDNPCCDELANIRVVRNTRPTPTGGTVVNLAPTAKSWVDDHLPASIKGPNGFGFTTAPVYYYVAARDKAGHFSRYAGTQVVVGSRTISGHVAGTNRGLFVFCCPNAFEPNLVTSSSGYSENVNAGAFSVHVPPGVYTVCSVDNQAANDATAACWQVEPDGSGHPRAWPGMYSEDVAYPSIDLRTAESYSGVDFRAN